MSDDMWRRRRAARSTETEEFGGPLFPDDEPPTAPSAPPTTRASGACASVPTTPVRCRTGPSRRPGEVPRMSRRHPRRPTTTTTTSTCGPRSPPSRRSGATTSPTTGPSTAAALQAAADRDPQRARSTRRRFRAGPSTPPARCRRRLRADRRPPPAGSTIGTDPSAPVPPPGPGRPSARPGAAERARRPARRAPAGPAASSSAARATAGGDHRRAVLAALFIVATLWRPGVLVLVVDPRHRRVRVLRQGHREGLPAGRRPGLAACVAAPLAAYWVGDAGVAARRRLRLHRRLPSGSSAPAASSRARCRTWPSPRWASCGSALLGSFAALIVRWSNDVGGDNIGTDTLFLVVLGVVANDIGALFVGSAIGKTPLRGWISPARPSRA